MITYARRKQQGTTYVNNKLTELSPRNCKKGMVDWEKEKGKKHEATNRHRKVELDLDLEENKEEENEATQFLRQLGHDLWPDIERH